MFGADFKLQIPLIMYKTNTHNINGMRNYFNDPNQLCMYVVRLMYKQ